MNLTLEVLLSTSIKHKKPWPGLHWIGQEKEAILLCDDQRLSVLTLSTGRTQRKIPKLQTLLKNVLTVATSANGAWLAGVLSTGELFLWKKDGDCLKTVAAADGVRAVVAAARDSASRLFLFVTRDGKRVLLVSQTGAVFVWEASEKRDLPCVPGTRLSGRWARVMADEQVRLPQAQDKDSAVHAVFLTDEVLGDCCFCSFVFTSGEALVLTTLELKWFEQVEQCISADPFSVQWVTQTHVLGGLIPGCDPVKSRGALLAAFSGDGLVLAVVINQNDPKATQVLFVNPLTGVTVSSSLQGCGSNGRPVPVRFIRSYWVGEVSWTHDGLFLACMLKRGALLLLSRLGEMVTITTFGCSVEFGPAEFIPLHPLITYRQSQSLLLMGDPTGSAASSTSENDPMKQQFSLAAHPRLPYLIVSDGYMFTVLRFAENVSASSVLKRLLLEVTQGLDDVRYTLMSSEHKDLKCCLQPMSTLRRSVLQGWGPQEPGTWTSPPFLQDETPAGSQADEGDESDDAAPCPTDWPRSQNSDPSTMEQGRLEFASMFDTLRAKQGAQADHLEAKLRRIQNGLLTAWSLGVSVKGLEGRELLLQYTVRAFLQFARLLPLAPATLPSSVTNTKNKMVKKALRRSPGTYRTLQLLRYCLTVLSWDTVHKRSLAPAVRLSADIVKLILSQKLGPASFSQSLLSSLSVLKLTSVHLDEVYSLRPQDCPDLPGHTVTHSLPAPVSHPADPGQKGAVLTLLELPSQTVHTARQPSHRLAFTWRLLYQHALQHHSRLRKLKQQSNRGNSRKRLQREEAILTSLLSQIQATLQTMGESLGPNRQLKPLAGEEHFLLGSYLESVQMWKVALQEEMGRDWGRAKYLQTRYCLAILYTHLYLYNLSAAQHLCEKLVRQILNREGPEISAGTDGLELDASTLLDVGVDAALAVVQTSARFMALYFTNRPLFVLPPHHIDTLPPLHFKPGRLARVVPVQRPRVADAVREQNLSAVWSVERAVDLMLVGRLIPEAVWLALELGDWKTAVVLGLAFNLYTRSVPEPVRVRWRSLHLPPDLHPSQIFQDKLQALLGRPVKTAESVGDCTAYPTRAPGSDSKHVTDSIEQDDADLLFGSVQEILKAAVMADADVLTESFDLLMQSAKVLGTSLPGLVPDGLYLPAPPLYCPQPAIDSEGGGEDPALSMERAARQKVSGVLQRVLLLFRAARCSLPAAHWYIGKLRYCRKIMNKIRGKAGIPALHPFPDSLLRYGKARSSSFRLGAGGDGTSDAISVRVIGSFRDLCGLCWMFHVREQLSESCRKYQRARDHTRSPQDYEAAAEYDVAVVDHCLASLDWACRMLPFARFMNAEELVQDIILSLVSELPPITQVAEILVQAFPDVEDVRVPLRDKYHALQQRLRHSTVRGPDGEEMMSLVLHELYRQRMKTLKRVVQNIGPTEQHIWERTEEGLREQQDQTYDRFSLGTSLSRSTLTDTRRAENQSDGDTTDNMSEPLPDTSEWQDRIQQQTDSSHRDTESRPHRTSGDRNDGPDCRRAAKQRKARGSEVDAPRPPVVGSWEFERDDEEYARFLELFLSYLLERDQIVNGGPAVPLLTSCSGHLREQELNSLAFHVHTTLKRRQSRTRADGEVFRAESRSRLTSEEHRKEYPGRGERTKPPVSSPAPATFCSTVRSEVPPIERDIHGYFPAVGTRGSVRGRGLFGLKLHSCPAPAPVCSTELPARADPSPWPCPSALALSREELAPELDARFQGTAKLLEWMIRWTERRLLCGPHKVEKLPDCGTAIRVKTSVPAILHSLWLLDRGLGPETPDTCNSRECERPLTVASVYQPEQPRLKSDGENNVDTGCPSPLGLEVDVEGRVEPFLQSDDAEDLQKQDLSHANLYSPQELTSDSDSRTEDEDSAESGGSSPEEQGNDDGVLSITNVGVYEEEDAEPRPCTPISPCISISIKPKPRARIRDTMDCSLEVESPRDGPSKDPGELEEQMGQPITKDPEELVAGFIKDPGELEEQMEGQETARVQRDSATMHPCSAQTTSQSSLETAADSPGRLPSPAPSCPDQTVVNCQSVSDRWNLPLTPAASGPAASQTLGPGGQAVNTSDVVRHMLQDEMYKLVQLQQINFMSIMQVVGSSLANLPGIQQTPQQLQPVLSQDRAPPTPNPTTNPTPSTRVPAPGEAECERPVVERPVVESNLAVPRSSSPPQEKVAQDPKELPLPPRPEDDHVCRRPRLPDSRSVPSSGHIPIRPPLLLGRGAQPPATPCQLAPGISPALGLPLLRLEPQYELRARPVTRSKPPCSVPLPQPTPREAWPPCPQPTCPQPTPREAWAPCPQPTPQEAWAPCPQPTPREAWPPCPQPTPREAWAPCPQPTPREAWPPCPQPRHRPQPGFPAHLNLSAYDPELLQQAAEEKSRREELLSSGPPKHLNLDQYQQPAASLRTSSPAIGPPNCGERSPRGFTPPAVPRACSRVLGMPLLHLLQPTHLTLLPLTARPPPNTWAEPGRPWSSSTVQCPTSQQQYSSFCQETQVSMICPPRLIPAQDLIAFEQSRLCKSQHSSGPQQAKAFRLLKVNIEPFESRTGCDNKKRLKRRCERRAEEMVCNLPQSDKGLIPANPTYTQKKPGDDPPAPDTTGCFTVPPETHCRQLTLESQYIVKAVQHTPVNAPQVLPPDVFMNLQFPSEVCQKPLQTLTAHAAPDQAVCGHKFLSVIDIDAGELLNDLPVTTTVTELMPSSEREGLSIPGLHLMAASVTNAVPPDTCPLLKRPSLSPDPPRTADWELQLTGDDLTQRLLQPDCARTRAPSRAPAHTVGNRQVRAQLSEMEQQLSALQDMAVNMEQDFANTKMLMNTIENLGCALDPEEPVGCSFPRGVSVLEAAALHSPSAVAEDEAEDLCYPRVVAAASHVCADWHRHTPPVAAEEEATDHCYPRVVAAVSPGCENWHRHAPSVAADDLRLSADHNQVSGEMESSTNEHLHLSGLSGVSDIIADLINEDKLSAQALGLSEEQAKKLSRYSKPPKRTEKEQKEIKEWMKRKRQQRLETYREHREELKERERAPYLPKKHFTSREIKEKHKQNEVKKRITLAVNRETRARAALSLMKEMLCDTTQLPTARHRTPGERSERSARSTRGPYYSTPRGRNAASRSVSAGRAEQSLSGTYTMMGRVRSVSSSPGRAPQAGSSRRAAQRSRNAYRGVTQHKQARPANRQSSLGPSHRHGAQHPANQSDSDSLTLWSTPEQIRQILDREDDPFLQVADLAEVVGGAETEISDVQSDSTSSILSNLDWNAVNRMVASLENQ
uniref:ciliogenesis and planar polarity effector 1 n=1 Tax=Pristiophorus japonicus TaxID=55135 RepID=UPI00398E864E